MGRKNLTYLILMLVYLGMVAWCCFGHFDGLPQVERTFFGIPSDKVVHFIMFLPFPFLCFKAFDHLATTPVRAVLIIGAILVIGCAIAAGTEIIQAILPDRTEDIKDFAADTAALCLTSVATLVLHLVNRRNRTKA